MVLVVKELKWRARQDSTPVAASVRAARWLMPGGREHFEGKREVARPAGLEPATLGLEGRCSIHLSYGRV